jgi:myo-inositol-1(or 4)-monophosphatase
MRESHAAALEAAVEAARAGAAVLMDWRGRFNVREKGPQDVVSEADLASQDAIQSVLLGRFPEHGFLAEEDCQIAPRDGRHVWIVDPLDGTTNYVHDVPQFAVSIALEEDGEIVAGVVLDPCADECFCAAAGGGAFLNGRPIRASRVASLRDALTVASFPSGIRRGDPEIERFIRVLLASQSLRRTGSSAINLAYLAAGRFDGYWATTTKAWDVAAGFLIAREAGAVLSDLEGGPIDLYHPRFVAASTPELHAELRKVLAGS